MKIVLYSNGQPHQNLAMQRFGAGLVAHGLSWNLAPLKERRECDLAVFWGHRQTEKIHEQKAKGGHYLVMERGYIGDRFKWTSLGFDGLNGRAKFPKIDDGGARWEQNFSQYLKPYKLPTKHKIAVIMGQCRGDASLPWGLDFPKWASDMAQKLGQLGYIPLFRAHPGDANMTVPGVKKLEGTLENALEQATIVATYNSNSGVDAILAGVLTIAIDEGSMVWEVANHGHQDRTSWAQKMAFTQWLPEEIESGDAWAALRTVDFG